MQILFTCSLQLCSNLRYLVIRDLSVKVNTQMGINDWRSGPSVRYQTLKFNYHHVFSFKKHILHLCVNSQLSVVCISPSVFPFIECTSRINYPVPTMTNRGGTFWGWVVKFTLMLCCLPTKLPALPTELETKAHEPVSTIWRGRTFLAHCEPNTRSSTHRLVTITSTLVQDPLSYSTLNRNT